VGARPVLRAAEVGGDDNDDDGDRPASARAGARAQRYQRRLRAVLASRPRRRALHGVGGTPRGGPRLRRATTSVQRARHHATTRQPRCCTAPSPAAAKRCRGRRRTMRALPLRRVAIGTRRRKQLGNGFDSAHAGRLRCAQAEPPGADARLEVLAEAPGRARRQPPAAAGWAGGRDDPTEASGERSPPGSPPAARCRGAGAGARAAPAAGGCCSASPLDGAFWHSARAAAVAVACSRRWRRPARRARRAFSDRPAGTLSCVAPRRSLATPRLAPGAALAGTRSRGDGRRAGLTRAQTACSGAHATSAAHHDLRGGVSTRGAHRWPGSPTAPGAC
jgi:hypothetical protein